MYTKYDRRLLLVNKLDKLEAGKENSHIGLFALILWNVEKHIFLNNTETNGYLINGDNSN